LTLHAPRSGITDETNTFTQQRQLISREIQIPAATTRNIASCLSHTRLSSHTIPAASNSHFRLPIPQHAQPQPKDKKHLSVGLGNTLELVLLLDGVAVAASLSSVDQLLSQALGNTLDVPEGGLTGTDGEERDGLVDTAEGRHIDGLSADGTGGTNTGGVFTGTAVDDGVYGDLERVCVGGDVDLEMSLVRMSFSSGLFRTSLRRLGYVGDVGGRTISKACATMRTAMSFFPLLRPFIMRALVRRSMMGHCALRNRLTAYFPAEWERYTGVRMLM